MNLNTKNKGFTLIELLVVISIISMLSSVILSSLGDARARAKNTVTLESLRQVKNALNLYATDMGGFPLVLNDLIVKGSISSVDPSMVYYPLASDGSLCTVAPCANYSSSVPNTSNIIVGVSNAMNWTTAKNYCSSFGAGSRLPTRLELRGFYASGIVSGGSSWTSEEVANNNAYYGYASYTLGNSLSKSSNLYPTICVQS